MKRMFWVLTLHVFLVGVFAPALWGDVGDGAFDDFEERLLYPFPRDVAGDRDIARRLVDFVDFVDVDDPDFCSCDIDNRPPGQGGG